MRPLIKLVPLFLALCWPLTAALAQRQTVDLPDGWKFIRQDAAPDAPLTDAWQNVNVPHCWNALDGQNGKAANPDLPEGYYRGPAWYARALDIPTAWKTRRVFIRFEAAFLVADVYLNGEHLGQHRGGFAAFCYELTPHLKFGAPNELRVRVDNSKNADIAPLSADFTMEGGIYRPVHLLVTDPTCITPLDFAGPGVYATPTKISADGADVEIETKLIGPAPASQTQATGTFPSPTAKNGRFSIPQVHTEIRDPQGQVVQQGDVGEIGETIKQHFHLARPHLWNGVKDPYVYTVNVKLVRDGEVFDEVTEPLGFRTVEVSQEKGFLLNGQPYPIHGVNRHQEKRDKGWALTPEDHADDLRMILEMGATAVRLAHYQQSAVVHDLADHDGLLLWQEIPLVNEITDSPAFTDNARQQLTEMIRQGYNHPSLMTWSLFNELYVHKTPPPEPLITTLDQLARELDPTRMPTGVSATTKKPDLVRITPWIGFNIYPGWYGGSTEDANKRADEGYQAAGASRPIAVTEYGAGANPAQHQEAPAEKPKPGGPFHPEEYQAFVHERLWTQLHANPHVWGTFVWAMFDFAVDDRNEGSTPGINDKGLVTEDRKVRKDAYYFYKANWNPEPMVYLAARRSTPRRQAVTEVKVYANCPQVDLKVNGQSVGSAQPDETHVCRWPNVTLQPGSNRVEAAGRAPGGEAVSDHCEWTLNPDPHG